MAARSPHRLLSPTLVLLCLAIFFLALLPRLGALDRYITPDELRWVDRSIRFSAALARGDFGSTIESAQSRVFNLKRTHFLEKAKRHASADFLGVLALSLHVG